MSTENAETITYSIDVSQQAKDGLITPQDMVEWMQGKLKVRNSKLVAQKEVQIENNADSVVLTTKKANIVKKNLKQYIKRYLRSKSLANFVKAHGNPEGFKLEYINKVEETD